MSPILQSFGNASARAFGWSRGAAGGGGGAMTLISTQILASTATTVTFSSIPQTYKHLQLRVTSRDTSLGSANYYLRANGDTAANYAWHALYGNGTSVGSQSNASSTQWLYIYTFAYQGNGPSSAYGVAAIDVLDYTSTAKNKTARALSGSTMTSSAGEIRLQSGLWVSTAAINSISVITDSTAFAIGSRFSLYGVLG